MDSELIKAASSQGIWAALSVALIFYILKAQEKRDIKQEEREQNYQNIITNLTENLILWIIFKMILKTLKKVYLIKIYNYFDLN